MSSEMCTVQELCIFLGSSEKLLIQLRDRLRDWLQLQPHLPQDISRKNLEWFILQTKFRLERAKQKLDMYYTIRSSVPELYRDRDPRQFASALKAGYIFMSMDIQRNECDHAYGIYGVFDLSMSILSHALKITPVDLKKWEITFSKVYALRVKGIHFINAPRYLDRLVTMIKSTASQKISERVHAHRVGDLESLCRFIPRSAVPKDYGGEQPTMDELAACSWVER